MYLPLFNTLNAASAAFVLRISIDRDSKMVSRKQCKEREGYNSLFKLMDPNEEGKGTSLPFQQAASSRWLVRGKVLHNILMNSEELKAYFMC